MSSLPTNAPSRASPPSRAAVLLHAVPLFVLSFLMSGNANVLPQLFFQRHYPERKVFFLAVCLLSATLSAATGVFLSRRGRPRAVVILAGLALLLAAVPGLFFVRGAALYVALTCFIQLGDNYLINRLDHAAVARAGSERRRLNDVAGNAARLLGMLSAPVLFAGLYDRPALVVLLLATVGAVALAGAARLTAINIGGGEVQSNSVAPQGAPLITADKLVFGYAIAVYAALYLFAANAIYVLRDVLQIDGAEQRGARAIMICFVSALGANGVMARRPPRDGVIRLLPFVLPAAVLAFNAGGLAIGVRVGYPGFLAGCVALGGSYGVFLYELRAYVSAGARLGGRSSLLTLFNNMANLSALGAFAIMLLGASLGARGTFYLWILGAITSLPLAGLPLIIAAARRNRAIQTGLSSPA